MPALSPFMTEGTVTRWTKKEGESFVAGDVLLQIENDVGMVDVEASAPGIMGKILTPDGTTHVPVEAVIALVARDLSELSAIQSQSLAPTPPPFSSTPNPPSATLSSPSRPRTPTPGGNTMGRTPSLFEMHTMGYGQRSIHVGGGSRGMSSTALGSPVPWPVTPTLDEAPNTPVPGSSRMMSTQNNYYGSEPSTPMPPKSAVPCPQDENQLDGAAIRRILVAKLSSSSRSADVDDLV